MNAKKCDRCGRFYELEGLAMEENGPKYVTMVIRNNIAMRTYDLCNCCLRELYDWMNYDVRKKNECER